VHIHADLIVGLPGEDLASFGRGFDRLVALQPQEIQVGILKRLRGTPIVRHDAEHGMVYSSHPPYEILQNRQLDFATMQRMRRFARYWDLIANSGNFVEATPLLWSGGASAFRAFLAFSDWLYAQIQRTHTIALETLARQLWTYLVEHAGRDREVAGRAIAADWRRTGRKDLPAWLESENHRTPQATPARKGPPRQSRHIGAA
jgi:hypothetical protein